MASVIKRDGRSEPAQAHKLLARLKNLSWGLDTTFINPEVVVKKVFEGLYDGVPTTELSQLAAETCAYLSTYHFDWSTLAARISVSDLHKTTSSSFSEVAKALHSHVHPKTGIYAPLISDAVWEVISANAERLDAAIDYKRDFDFDFFGYKTLERSYLMRIKGKVAERPQHMYMRVALGIHLDDIEAALHTYELMSKRVFTHATPTLFNAGTPNGQLSSCFLLQMKEDSIEGIYETLKQCALISKSAGGIGLSVHNIRASNSYIRGTNGTSNGLVPMLRVFSDTARYVDQGGGKRRGAFAIYLEPWHADIFDFLELRKNSGKEEMRARDLFIGLWCNDLFMQRVEADASWSLFCPNEAPGLAEVVGAEFEALFTRYEKEGRARRTFPARELWFAILQAQAETGGPYMLYKDACNLKSNQQNLGTIKCSNLCTEVVEYTSPDEVAVCNLASIAVNMFVKTRPVPGGAAGEEETYYDYEGLADVARTATRNLNRVIDRSYYPVEESRRSNMRHRPIGIGIQGFADALALMRFPFETPEAADLNRRIFAAIYYGAVDASCELAEKDGPYASFPGSPASQGKLQFDLWGVKPAGDWDWEGLKARVVTYGIRNSLLLAPMPTASTAQILGNCESFEPFTSNLYVRRVLAGEFPVVNRHLVRDLVSRGLWTEPMRMAIVAAKGSIQGIGSIPADIRALYRTVWEIKQRTMIDLAADRGAYICQSQSLNLFLSDPTFAKMTSMHFYAWKKGLKTGLYYLRSQPRADAIAFTVDHALAASVGLAAPAEAVPALTDEDTATAPDVAETPLPDACVSPPTITRALPAGLVTPPRAGAAAAAAPATPPPAAPAPEAAAAEEDAETMTLSMRSPFTRRGGAPVKTAPAAAPATAAAPGSSPLPDRLQEIARQAAIKRAELRERMARGEFDVVDNTVCFNCSS